jgi:hypothetical protein
MAEKKWDNTNSGALFNARDKKQKDTWPDYSGQINVEGKDYWLSAWIKTSRTGDKFFSLAVRPKKAVVAQRTEGNGVADLSDDDANALNDSIPF